MPSRQLINSQFERRDSGAASFSVGYSHLKCLAIHRQTGKRNESAIP